MSAFAAAVGALFADPNIGQDAVYTPEGGAPKGEDAVEGTAEGEDAEPPRGERHEEDGAEDAEGSPPYAASGAFASPADGRQPRIARVAHPPMRPDGEVLPPLTRWAETSRRASRRCRRTISRRTCSIVAGSVIGGRVVVGTSPMSQFTPSPSPLHNATRSAIPRRFRAQLQPPCPRFHHVRGNGRQGPLPESPTRVADRRRKGHTRSPTRHAT